MIKQNYLTPLISIIVPIYKSEHFLPQCLNSILAQNYKNLEIILVDDGSPDHSGNICEEYAKKDSRVIVIHKQNGGAASARNVGLDMARGEYVGFVDSDDTIEPDMFQALYKAIKETKADMAVCGVKLIYSEFIRTVTVPEKGFVCKEKLCENYVKNYNQYSFVLPITCNKLISMKLLEASDRTEKIRFPENMVNFEDGWFNNRLIDKLTNGVAFVDITPYNYHLIANDNSLSKQASYSNGLKVLSQWAKIMKRHAGINKEKIENVKACQKAVLYMYAISGAIIYNKRVNHKLNFSQVRIIIKYSSSMIEKFSAIILYVFPPMVYKIVFNTYGKLCSFIKTRESTEEM